MEPMLFTKAQVADYLGITILSLNKYISFDPWYKDFPKPVHISSKTNSKCKYVRTDIDDFIFNLKQKQSEVK